MSRCECCDLPPGQCGTAAERTEAAETRALRLRVLDRPGVMPATYGGGCASCSTRYAVGDPIKRTRDGWSGALCCPDVDVVGPGWGR